MNQDKLGFLDPVMWLAITGVGGFIVAVHLFLWGDISVTVLMVAAILAGVLTFAACVLQAMDRPPGA